MMGIGMALDCMGLHGRVALAFSCSLAMASYCPRRRARDGLAACGPAARGCVGQQMSSKWTTRSCLCVWAEWAVLCCLDAWAWWR